MEIIKMYRIYFTIEQRKAVIILSETKRKTKFTFS